MSPWNPSAFSTACRCRTSSLPSTMRSAMPSSLRTGSLRRDGLASPPMWPPAAGGTWVLDLDGVVWLSGRPIPGVDEAVARLRGAGVRVLFATNNSSPTRAELKRRLDHCGIAAADDDLLRSADVAAGLLQPGTTAVVSGRRRDHRGPGGAWGPGRDRRTGGRRRRRLDALASPSSEWTRRRGRCARVPA